jgi:hypothetical protein
VVSPVPGVPTITQTGNTLFGPPNFSYLWILNGDTLPDQTQSITAQASGTYVLVVRNAGGCSRNSQPKVVTITSVNGLQSSAFEAYPNPADDVLHISLKGKNPDGMELRNGLGQLLKARPYAKGDGHYDLELNGLSPGSYWLIIHTQTGIQRISFLKK